MRLGNSDYDFNLVTMSLSSHSSFTLVCVTASILQLVRFVLHLSYCQSFVPGDYLYRWRPQFAPSDLEVLVDFDL